MVSTCLFSTLASLSPNIEHNGLFYQQRMLSSAAWLKENISPLKTEKGDVAPLKTEDTVLLVEEEVDLEGNDLISLEWGMLKEGDDGFFGGRGVGFLKEGDDRGIEYILDD